MGSWTTVKEQMAELSVQRLAQDSFVTLAFDFDTGAPAKGTRCACSACGVLLMNDGSTERPRIARIWRGRTKRERADEYEAYNYEVGIKPPIEKTRLLSV
jgi:hypothetical protein